MLLTLALSIAAAASGAVRSRVVVEAGAAERRQAPVTFMAPRPPAEGHGFVLTDDRGRPVPVHSDERGEVAFVLTLAAGARASFVLEERPLPKVPRVRNVTVKTEARTTRVLVDGRPLATYRGQALRAPDGAIEPEFLRGGYLHPVVTPGGVTVTDDYPPDHLHHHGVWTSFAETEFEGRRPDFWNMGKKSGRTQFESVGPMWESAVSGGLRARHIHVDLLAPAPKTALREQWRLVAWRTHDGRAPYFLFDLELTEDAIGGAPVTLRQHRYGGLGVRGHRQWRGVDGAVFLTSEGKDRAGGDAQRARWVHMGGKVDGKLAGIAVLDHPGNPASPQPARLHPEEPFLSFAPMQAGAIVIRSGEPLRLRYRFVVADGRADAALLERLWTDYAQPPRVNVEPIGP